MAIVLLLGTGLAGAGTHSPTPTPMATVAPVAAYAVPDQPTLLEELVADSNADAAAADGVARDKERLLARWEAAAKTMRDEAAAALAAREAVEAQAAADRAALAEQARASRPRTAVSTAPSVKRAPAHTPAGGDLAAIRQCESTNNYAAVSPSGKYRGAYQFDQQTWQSVGGSGDPAAAPPAEQDARARQLQQQRGNSPWPQCG